MIPGPTKGDNVMANSNMLQMSRRRLLKSWIVILHVENFSLSFKEKFARLTGIQEFYIDFFSFLPNL